MSSPALPERPRPAVPGGKATFSGSGLIWRAAYGGLVLPLAAALLPLAALFSRKLRDYRAARRDWRAALEAALARRPDLAAGDALWVHAASAGETLQARALLRALRQARPAAPLVLTHTSPSAATALERFQGADLVFPLPLDTRSNVRHWLDALRPSALGLVDAELWPNLVAECSRRQIPVALVSARLAGGARRMRACVRPLYVDLHRRLALVASTDEASAEQFRSSGVGAKALRVTGDLRVDETMRRVEGMPLSSGLPLPGIVPVLVAGSTWPDDEAVLLPALERLRDSGVFFSLAIAPHEVGGQRLEGLERALEAHGFTPARLDRPGPPDELGEIAPGGPQGERGSRPVRQRARVGRLQLELVEPPAVAADLVDAIVVDRVGLLYRLYAGAAAAYVGGGFHGGLHNVMEPAALGVPVVTGPRTRRSWAAGAMIAEGGLFPVADVEAAVAVLEHLLTGPAAAEAGERARRVLLAHAGAARRTVQALEEVGWLGQTAEGAET